jgi:hypothetical protein
LFGRTRASSIRASAVFRATPSAGRAVSAQPGGGVASATAGAFPAPVPWCPGPAAKSPRRAHSAPECPLPPHTPGPPISVTTGPGSCTSCRAVWARCCKPGNSTISEAITGGGRGPSPTAPRTRRPRSPSVPGGAHPTTAEPQRCRAGRLPGPARLQRRKPLLFTMQGMQPVRSRAGIPHPALAGGNLVPPARQRPPARIMRGLRGGAFAHAADGGAGALP